MVFPGTWTPPPFDSCKHGWHCHAPCEGSSLCLQTGGECHLPCSHGRLGARPGPGGSREVSESLPGSPGSSWYFLRSMSQLEKKKKKHGNHLLLKMMPGAREEETAQGRGPAGQSCCWRTVWAWVPGPPRRARPEPARLRGEKCQERTVGLGAPLGAPSLLDSSLNGSEEGAFAGEGWAHSQPRMSQAAPSPASLLRPHGHLPGKASAWFSALPRPRLEERRAVRPRGSHPRSGLVEQQNRGSPGWAVSERPPA